MHGKCIHLRSLSLFLCIKKSKKEGTFFPRTKNILSLRRKKVCQWQQSSAEEKTRDKKDRALENKKATIRKVSYSFMLGTNKHIMYMSGRKEIIYLSKILPLWACQENLHECKRGFVGCICINGKKAKADFSHYLYLFPICQNMDQIWAKSFKL